MGWFWDRNPPPENPDNSDPLRNLDPSLREFLEKESPLKYTPAASSEPTIADAADPNSTTSQKKSPAPLVPPESLFQDGRYAYLWKNYRPQGEVEAESKTDQERLHDVFDAYKERRSSIGYAAAENCVLEQIAVNDCYAHGSLWDRLNLCRPQSRAFDKCYYTQAKFLKALGYLSTYQRTEEEEEKIQMHADKLYHQMLEQEKAIEAAKAAGKPLPSFAPIMAPDPFKLPKEFQEKEEATPHALAAGENAVPETPAEINRAAVAAAKKFKEDQELPPLTEEAVRVLNPKAALALRKRMKDMTPLEREAEERATLKVLESAIGTGAQIESYKEEKRQRRREAAEKRPEWQNWLIKTFGGPRL